MSSRIPVKVLGASGELVVSASVSECATIKSLKMLIAQEHFHIPRFVQRLVSADGMVQDDDVLIESLSLGQPVTLTLAILPWVDDADSLVDAVRVGRVQGIEEQLCRPVDPNGLASDCQHAILLAAQVGQSAILGLLLEAKADVDKKMFQDDRTPTFIAAAEGRTEILRLLLSARAHVDAASKRGMTPTCIAADRGHVETVKLLVAAMADVNASRNDGGTPLLMASGGSAHGDVLESLISGRADVNRAAENGTTALLLAAGRRNARSVQLLISARADLAAARGDGTTAIHKAAECGALEIVQLLVGLGVDVNTPVLNSGATPCFIAAWGGHALVVQYLVAAEADVSLARFNQDGRTPVFAAAQNGHIETLEHLVAARADVNTSLHDGTTPLCAAYHSGHLLTVRFLLDSKADVLTAVKETGALHESWVRHGMPAAFFAYSRRHSQITELLVEASAHVDDSWTMCSR